MGTAPFVTVRNRTKSDRLFTWEPAKIGPCFEWLDHDNIRILEGGLKGRTFGLQTDIRQTIAVITLHENGHWVGEVDIERNPPGRGIILWDAGVREDLRGNGLCAIMTYCIFRELLLVQREAFFKIRMVRLLKTGSAETKTQNIGMGVIAARLGFTPELNLERLLRYENITQIEVLPGANGQPPGLKIDLRVDPLTIVAFILSPDTMRPTASLRTYLEIKNDDQRLRDWAAQGLLFINGNYCLRTARIDHFVNRLACDEPEALLFRQRVRGI